MESYPGLTAIPFWVLSLYCATRCSRGAIRDFSLRPAIRRDWAAFCASRFARFGDSADPDARRHARTCPYRRRPTLASTHAHSLITIRVLDHTRAHRRAHVRSRAHTPAHASTHARMVRARTHARARICARAHIQSLCTVMHARAHISHPYFSHTFAYACIAHPRTRMRGYAHIRHGRTPQ